MKFFKKLFYLTLLSFSIFMLSACEDAGNSAIDLTKLEVSTLSYNFVDSMPGDVVDVAGSSYSIYKVPVIDKYNGKLYQIKMPSAGNPFLKVTRFNEIDITPNEYAPAKLTYIDGYPATIHEECSFLIDGSEVGKCKSFVYIKVDLALFVIKIDHATIDNFAGISFSGFDYTGIPAPDLSKYDMSAHVDAFIDYIDIEDLTPD